MSQMHCLFWEPRVPNIPMKSHRSVWLSLGHERLCAILRKGQAESRKRSGRQCHDQVSVQL